MWISSVLTAIFAVQASVASIYDCWDQDKLNRMQFPLSHQEANDPSLGKFSKLLKCLMQQQSKEPGGLSNMDWSQWQAVAGGGQFPPQGQNVPGWNPNQQPPGWMRPGQQQPQQPPQQQWPPNQPNQPGGSQPRPGVHPDDWNGNNPNPVPPMQPPMSPPGSGNGWPPQQQRPPPPNGPPPGWEDGRNRNNNDGNRKKNRRKQQQQNFDLDDSGMIPSPGPSLDNNNNGLMNPPPTGPQWGTNVGAVNDEESRTMSRNRQYGYAVMACAVVALAVLMVSAIFCCNSSNSTMSQPATTVAVQPPDTFSIYSYTKQPVVTDTLRSGPLGDTLRTETMRSAASPQYRVSDIDPEFARRFREEHY